MRQRKGALKLVSRTQVRTDPGSVMAYVLDPSSWPEWQPEIITSEGPVPLQRGNVVTGTARMLGFTGVQGRSAAVEVGPGFFEEDVVVGIGMRVRYEVSSEGELCVITHRLESDLPRGVAGRVLSLLLRRRLKRLQRSALERLAVLAQRTEQTTPRGPDD